MARPLLLEVDTPCVCGHEYRYHLSDGKVGDPHVQCDAMGGEHWCGCKGFQRKCRTVGCESTDIVAKGHCNRCYRQLQQRRLPRPPKEGLGPSRWYGLDVPVPMLRATKKAARRARVPVAQYVRDALAQRLKAEAVAR